MQSSTPGAAAWIGRNSTGADHRDHGACWLLRRATGQARERIVEEAEAGEPADRREEEAHEDADVVLVRAEQVVLADCELAAEVGAEEEAADPECDRREEVECECAA